MLTVPLTISSTVQQAAGILTQLFGLAALAGVLGGGLAVGYRWYTGSRVPQWLAILVGTAGVALYLGTTAALEEVIRSDVQPTEVEIVLFNLTALLAGGGGAALGRVVGDRFSTDVLLWSPTQDADDVGQLAQTVGRVTTVQLPTTIDDAAGYDPIPERRKERLAGKRLVFPRGLTVDELDQRLTERLKSDYAVGTVDIEFDDNGAVTHLAVGTRAAGIGSTLPPATNAVAVRADPGFSASTGDIVQLWTRDPPRRVLTGELRGVADDVVTIAVDAGDTPRVDPTQRYRLVTLPVNDRPDREFASLLRAAEETFSSVTVEAGSPLHGLPVGALDLTITAIRAEDGEPVPFPEPTYRLAPGDLLFVIARPAGLRRLERGAQPLDPSLASSSLPADDSEPAEGITTADESETERDEPTGEDGLPASHEQSEGDGATDGASAGDESDSAIQGKADADSFDEIKAQFEATDSQAAAGTEQETEAEDEPREAIAEDSQGSTEISADSEGRSEPSFDDLKSEFDSGEADWGERAESTNETIETAESTNETAETAERTDDETDEPDVEIAFSDESGPGSEDEPADAATDSPDEADESDDGLVSLEEADITFEDEQSDDNEPDESPAAENSAGTLGDLDIDDDLRGDEGDTVSDDIGNLEFEEEDSEEFGELGFEDEEDPFDTVDDSDEDDAESDEDDQDDEDDEDDDSGSSGGGSSFADLKAEFESGEADWEDDISDSPGGDMRLDE
ncbi:MAG: TrkA C-terminal domain-containing protein [Halovenus sp.]